MNDHLLELKESLSNAVSRSVKGADRIGILFSGGLDSSLIAFLAKKSAQKAEITLYTVGTEDSQDLLNAEFYSKMLKMRWKKIVINIEDIIEAIPKVGQIIDSKHPVKMTFELPLYLSLTHIGEELILSGQGADEMFGGYARYLKMDGKTLEIALKNDVEELLESGIQMDHAIAKHFNKSLRTPYLDEDVVKIAMQIPVELKVSQGKRKVILMDLAENFGLPSEIVNKEKKAVQYSSGIIKELRKEAKRKKMGVNELIEQLLKDK